MSARQRITSAGSFQQFPVANPEDRLLVRGLLAAQEYLHFVVVMSTGEESADANRWLEK
jgi:hypothetical protein